MRIVGGAKKGHRITAPKTPDTRPMSDIARESLFNILGDISGLSVLDAYAGSGAVAFESLSRGASKAVAIDKAKLATDSIKKNAFRLGFGDEMVVKRVKIEAWAESNADEFDVVFADPPFAEFEPAVLKVLSRKCKSIFVVKQSSDQEVLRLQGMDLLTVRRYGRSAVVIYKKSNVDNAK